MKRIKKLISIAYMVIGIALICLALLGIVNEFWNGLGFGLTVVGILQMIRILRLEKNDAYREKMEVEANDERNRFISNKAWAWAGYIFVLSTAAGMIVLKILKLDLYASAAFFSMFLILVLYWVVYYILKKKY